MAVKTQFSNDELRFILSHYQLGVYVDAQAISSGTVQTVLLLESTQGKFILKYYENRTPESVGFETNLLFYISKRNFPCAVPMRNRKNAFYALYKEKPFVLYEYIKGHPIEKLNVYHQEQVIKVAATLQKITRDYLPQNRYHRWNYTYKFCNAMIERCRSQITDERFFAKADWYQQQLDSIVLDAKLPKSICHCDYDYSNILWHDNQLIALIDFDDANLTYMAMDLIYLMDNWAWSEDYSFNLRQAMHIIDTYCQTRDLNMREKKHTYELHKLKTLIDSIWFFHEGNPDDFPAKRQLNGLEAIGYERYTKALFGAKYLR